MRFPIRLASVLGLVLSLSSLAVGCDGESGVISTSADLTAALAAASPGDRVCMEAGTFVGSFEVPAGVELCGAGVGATRIVGPSDRPAVTAVPGLAGQPTRITMLSIEVDGAFGIMAVGAGELEVESVGIAVPQYGAGLGVEDLTAMSLTAVAVQGPITVANANAAVEESTLDVSPAFGIVTISAASVDAVDVSVSGFAHFGYLAIGGDLNLSNSTIADNLGTGLLVYGGTARIEGVDVAGSLQGTRLVPPYNAVFAGNADVMSSNLDVSDGEGYGVLQSEATATHVDLMAANNASAALWVQSSPGFSLTNGTLESNGMAGVVALQSSALGLSQVEINGTRAVTRIFDTAPVMVGDGVQLLGSTTDVILDAVTMANNSRVGVLIDLDGGAFDRIDVTSVTVSGTGTQLGAIAQNGTIPVGWDANITRDAVIDANDLAFSGVLETVGIVGPSDLPAIDMIAAGGIAGIVGPSD